MKSNPVISFKPTGEITIHVCAWCWPGYTGLSSSVGIYAFQALNELKLSHGICKRHRIELYVQLGAK